MIKMKYIYFMVMVVLAFTASESIAQNVMESKHINTHTMLRKNELIKLKIIIKKCKRT